MPLAPSAQTGVARHRDLIDQALDRYSRFGPGCPAQLAAAMRYMLLAPGKRIRPLLVLYAAEACAGDVGNALPAAVAVEMIHTYSLIHDDLPCMDDDELRRGQPVCHRKFDEATAILAGDALQSRAFEIMANDLTVNAARCVATLARASGAEFLVGGQADDLGQSTSSGNPSLASGKPSADQAEVLEQIHLRKTAALLSAATVLGGLAADASREMVEQLAVYGKKLGLAFQIVDDLLDFCGDGNRMGKQTGIDRRNGTLTYPGLLGTDESRRRARSLVNEAVSSLKTFGPGADPLRQIATVVLERES